MEQWINDERLRFVVIAERETVGLRGDVQRVADFDVLLFAVSAFLERDGRGVGDGAVVGVGDQFALGSDFQLGCAFEFDFDLRWVLLWRDGEDFSTLLPVARS